MINIDIIKKDHGTEMALIILASGFILKLSLPEYVDQK